MNLITIVGARPQFIKAAAFSAAWRQYHGAGGATERLLHTGQHFDDNMSEVFFRELGLATPAWNLGLGGGHHGEMTGAQLGAIEKVLLAESPDCVLVYGDTNSTLAGALAAAKLHIPVAHVEAGLRSFNRRMPEEINRVLTDHAAEWLFAPTPAAVGHLRREGIAEHRIHCVGDVMYDASLYFARQAGQRAQRHELIHAVKGRPFALATIHRAENTGDPVRLASIVEALVRLSAEIEVVWPLHPRTRQALGASVPQAGRGLHLTEPLGYLDMAELEQGAALVVTDSGGVQKEAFFFKTPCVTVREETEWTELVEAGWNRLSPPGDAARLLDSFRSAVGSQGRPISPYGHGDAARRIIEILASRPGRAHG